MEDSNNDNFKSQPFSIKRSDWARITRMAKSKYLNPSAFIRSIVMPVVEMWEREQGLINQDPDSK